MHRHITIDYETRDRRRLKSINYDNRQTQTPLKSRVTPRFYGNRDL